MRGIPLFGSMIGLAGHGRTAARLLGVIHLPILERHLRGRPKASARREMAVALTPAGDPSHSKDSIMGTGDIAQFDEAGLP